MQQEGIRKVMVEQGVEGAIVHIAELIAQLYTIVHEMRAPQPKPPVVEPKKEGEYA